MRARSFPSHFAVSKKKKKKKSATGPGGARRKAAPFIAIRSPPGASSLGFNLDFFFCDS